MTPRPQFNATYIEAELQDLGTTLHDEVTAFLMGPDDSVESRDAPVVDKDIETGDWGLVEQID